MAHSTIGNFGSRSSSNDYYRSISSASSAPRSSSSLSYTANNSGQQHAHVGTNKKKVEFAFTVSKTKPPPKLSFPNQPSGTSLMSSSSPSLSGSKSYSSTTTNASSFSSPLYAPQKMALPGLYNSGSSTGNSQNPSQQRHPYQTSSLPTESSEEQLFNPDDDPMKVKMAIINKYKKFGSDGKKSILKKKRGFGSSSTASPSPSINASLSGLNERPTDTKKEYLRGIKNPPTPVHDDFNEGVADDAELFVIKPQTLHKNASKHKRYLYNVNNSVSEVIAKYSPKFLAHTLDGSEILQNIAELQSSERINHHLGGTIVASRRAKTLPYSLKSSGRSSSRHNTSNSRLNNISSSSNSDEIKRTLHQAGSHNNHRRLLRMIGTNGASYTLTAGGKKQYKHNK